MKTDLPRLMQERELDALVIVGPDGLAGANTAFKYFTGAAHVTNGMIIVKRSGSQNIRSTLAHTPMERDEAAHTGLELVSLGDYDMRQFIQQANGSRLGGRVEFMRRLLNDLEVSGRVGFYGADAIGPSFAWLDALSSEEFIEVVTEFENDVISEARKTKDAQEVALIRQACRLTEDVIGATRDFLHGHRVLNETLIKPDGQPLTVGDVKGFIRREEAGAGLEDPGCIFAIGHDSGVPHSSGTATDLIRLGQTMVFDIFPRLDGYYADITRTWCLGYASDEVQQAYEQVMEVHDSTAAAFSTRRWTYEYQEMACSQFELSGHSTVRQNMGATSGYLHGLGHGFGLDVHEAPGMSLKGMRLEERLAIGTIITNEPGLYYPDKGWGVRVEDDYWCNPEGQFECLTSFDRSLVVEMK